MSNDVSIARRISIETGQAITKACSVKLSNRRAFYFIDSRDVKTMFNTEIGAISFIKNAEVVASAEAVPVLGSSVGLNGHVGAEHDLGQSHSGGEGDNK